MKNDPCWTGYKMVGSKKKGGRTVPNCVTSEGFRAYVAHRDLDEGFFDSMKQGFQSQYAKNSVSQESGEDYEKYSSKVLPAIQKASAVAKKYADKLGIPLPLATAVVSAGLVGGPGAVPFAALLYFVRKQVNNVAGKAFDKGAEKLGLAAPAPAAGQQAAAAPVAPVAGQQAASKLVLPGSSDWNGGRVSGGRGGRLQRSWTSFEDYKDLRDLHEGWFGDKVSQAGNWAGNKISQGEDYWKNTGADKVGGAVGKAAGYLSGNAKKYGSKIGGLVKSSFNDLSQFASQNKLAIGKAAFLFSVGVALGTGVGMAYNALAGGDELASQAIGGLKDSGVVSGQELDSVSASVGVDSNAAGGAAAGGAADDVAGGGGITSKGGGHYSNPDGTTGWVDPNPGGPGATKLGQSVVDTPSGQQVSGTSGQSGSNRFWGRHIGEPVAGLPEPEVDPTGTLPKGRLYDGGRGNTPAPSSSSWSGSGGQYNDDGTITQTPIPQHAQGVQNQIDAGSKRASDFWSRLRNKNR